MTTDRELATALGAEKQKNSAFDAMGAFNKYYNKAGNASLVLPLDFGKAVPVESRGQMIGAFSIGGRTYVSPLYYNPVTNQEQPVDPNKPGFWQNVGSALEKSYNFASQAVSFGIQANDKNSPLWSGGSFNPSKLRETWDAAGDISPGQAAFSEIAQGAGQLLKPVDMINSVAKKATGEKETPIDRLATSYFLAATTDFNIYDQQQRQKAFSEQTFGKVGSWMGDAVARFYIDPAVIGGKAIKLYKAGAYTLKKGDDLTRILRGQDVAAAFGEDVSKVLTRREQRIANTFNDFITATDDMTEAQLFRIKSIRESAAPAALSSLIADANKIEDVTTRHAAKIDLIHMAMGDHDAYMRLAQSNRLLAAKVGALNMEVDGAKYLGSGVDDMGQPVFDYLNKGPVLEKANELIVEYQSKMDDIYRKMSAEGTLNPTLVPRIDGLSNMRNYMANSQNFIDMRTGLPGAVVRFHTGFFYKRPKTWIDFGDNQSIQTVDNLLSRVVGVSEKRAGVFAERIDEVNAKIKSGLLSKEDLKAAKNELKKVQSDFDKANFTVARKNELFSKYAQAIGPDERSLVYQQIERELFDTIALQFGYSKEQIATAYNVFASGRTRTINLIKERSYTGGKDPVTGKKLGAKLVAIPDSEGLTHVLPLPLNESQLMREMATLDIDTMYKVLGRYNRAESLDKLGAVQNIYKGAIRGKNIATDVIDGIDQMLKFQVLARLGYPVRNVTEGSMRIMTAVGPLALAHAATAGTKNLIFNGLSKVGMGDVFNFAERHDLETQRLVLEAIKDTSDNPMDIQKQIDEITEILTTGKGDKQKYGVGTISILGHTFEDAKGLTPEQVKFIEDKFVNNSSKIFEDIISKSKVKMDNAMQNTGDFVDIAGNDPQWAEAYLRVVNRQMRNPDSLTGRIMQGQSLDEVVTWLKTDPQGQRTMRIIGAARGGESAEEIARINFENVRHMFPDWVSPELVQTAVKRNLTADDITKFFGTTNTAEFPVVNGAQIAVQNGLHPVSKLYHGMLEKFYENFGQVPENTLSKSPLYVDLYRRRLAALADKAIQTTKGDSLSPEYMKSMEWKARQFARSEMKRTLYDISERTDAAFTLKYFFPFFGAFSDVMEKWGRMVIDDPSVMARLSTVYNSPDRVGLTEERDGKTFINIPSTWSQAMGIDRKLSIPKASLNLIFQGGAWWNPGAGWFMQAAASELVTRYSTLETNRLIQEILPYGPTMQGANIIDKSRDVLIQSGGLRKILAGFDQNDPQRANLTALILAEEMTNYEQGLRDTVPTKKEINDRAIRTIALEAASRLTLPFALNTRSPYQFYIDEFQRMRSADPENAKTNFYNAYGEQYYNFTISLSKNNTGISATTDAFERSKKLSDLIAINPEYGWFVVGDANAGAFSPTAYGAQFSQPVAPGSTVKFRSKQDPYEAFAKTQADKGWLLYKQGMAWLESRRIATGFTSLNAKGAEYLAAKKREFINNLTKENAAWGEAYTQIDTGKVVSFLRYATEISADPRMAGRADITTLSEYVAGREFIIKQLQYRPTKNLDADSNIDLREKWDTFVGQLLNKDVTFGDIYSRILDKDDLSRSIG